MRVSRTYEIESLSLLKDKLLKWSDQFREVIWLDSNDFPRKYEDFDAVLAVDAFTLIKTDSDNAFEKLKEYQSNTKDTGTRGKTRYLT